MFVFSDFIFTGEVFSFYVHFTGFVPGLAWSSYVLHEPLSKSWDHSTCEYIYLWKNEIVLRLGFMIGYNLVPINEIHWQYSLLNVPQAVQSDTALISVTAE